MSFVRPVLAFGFALAATLAAAAAVRAEPIDPWPGLKAEIFQDRAIAEAAEGLILEAPVRAEDAAIVPMTLRFAAPDRVKAATLVIDQNPMPVAAVFTFGPDAGVTFISTRVRVNSYTNVHTIVEAGTARCVRRSNSSRPPAAVPPRPSRIRTRRGRIWEK